MATKETTKKGDYQLTVDDKTCILKKPTRATIEIALGKMGVSGGQSELIRAGEIILRNCWVDGDAEILNNDDYLIPAALQAYQLIEFKTAELKKI